MKLTRRRVSQIETFVSSYLMAPWVFNAEMHRFCRIILLSLRSLSIITRLNSRADDHAGDSPVGRKPKNSNNAATTMTVTAPGSTPARRRKSGGAEGIRTPDLINAIDALSQLSYSPTVLGWRCDLALSGFRMSPE